MRLIVLCLWEGGVPIHFCGRWICSPPWPFLEGAKIRTFRVYSPQRWPGMGAAQVPPAVHQVFTGWDSCENIFNAGRTLGHCRCVGPVNVRRTCRNL